MSHHYFNVHRKVYSSWDDLIHWFVTTHPFGGGAPNWFLQIQIMLGNSSIKKSPDMDSGYIWQMRLKKEKDRF